MKTRREKLYNIVFEADTRAGKIFDVALLVVILISVLAVMLESVAEIDAHYHVLLRTVEWIITIIFTLEYFLRIAIVKRPLGYIFSFYGIIDLLSIIPTYLSVLFIGSQSFIVIRALRLLRIFRIFKLNRHLSESRVIISALRASRTKIAVFIYSVIMIVIIIGTIMYLIEGSQSGFTSIPRGIYWAIVTLTTVGYGDIAPVTTLGQTLASLVMILGYAIIAVPTGIVTAEMTRSRRKKITTEVCPHCLAEGHDHDAVFCKICGEKLNNT